MRLTTLKFKAIWASVNKILWTKLKDKPRVKGGGDFAKHRTNKGMISKMKKQTRKRKVTQQFKKRKTKCPVNVKNILNILRNKGNAS